MSCPPIPAPRTALATALAILCLALVAAPPPAAGGDVVYQAGAASADITPLDWREERYWIAGFGPDRYAQSVNDPLLVRALVLDDGLAPLALVAVDLLGICSNDVAVIQGRVEAAVPELEGRVLVHATHSHEGPDTVGLWGGRGDIPFVNPRPFDYIERIGDQAAAAVTTAWADRVPVTVTLANVATERFEDLFTDSRDPQVWDGVSRLMVFEDEAGATVATLVNWLSHPEVLGSENTALTGDYVKWVADEIQESRGGTAVFVNGAIGGLLSSASDSIFPELPPDSFEKAEAIGRAVGARFLDALAAPRPDERVESFATLPPMTFATRTYYVPVENLLFLAAQPLGRIPKDLYFQSEIPEKERWRPWWQVLTIYTDFTTHFITIGPAAILTMGGELYPELLVGGVEPLGIPPYVYEPAEPPLVRNPTFAGYDYQFFFGLTDDFTGYVVPVQQWDGFFDGEYGEDFATSWDEAQIMSWNMHLLMMGYESFQYPPIDPPFLPQVRRDRPTSAQVPPGPVSWDLLYRRR